MVKKFYMSILFIIFCVQCVSTVSYGFSAVNSAEVLPKGRSRFRSNTTFFLPVKHRYDPHGDIEDIATDYNATLNKNIFPSLSLLETTFGLPSGSANLGNTIIDFEYNYTVLNFSFFYGITDKLTAGVRVPYIWAKNKVKAAVDTSGATVGKNPSLGRLLPLTVPGTVPVTDEDVQSILGPGLDIDGNGTMDVPGFGYKRFRTWSQNGIGDIETIFRYQYLKTKKWRLAANFGVRFPTGEIDDEDNLVDFNFFNFGTYGLLFRLNHDYTGIKNHVINGTVRYDLILPNREELRVLDDKNVPITINKEKVRRDIGDIVQIAVSDKYTPFKGFQIGLLYNFKFKYKNDRVSGDMGFAYDALEKETSSKSHSVIIGLSYSTVPLFLEKGFPIPMSVDISYRNRFSGRDNAMKSQFINFGLNIYF